MNEDLDNLIKELTDAGASDSEISAILDERLKSPQPAGGTFVDPKAQVEANKIAMGAANPLFGAAMQIPVFGDYLYSSAAKLGSTMSDQIPMGINQAAAGTIRGSYDEEALSGKYPTYSQLQGLTKADIYNKYSDANNDTVKKWIKSQVGVGSNKLGFKEILDKAYKLVGKDNPTTPELYDAIKTAYAYNKADFKNENLDQAEVQSKESQDKLTGIAQSSEDIKDVSSFASYMGDKFGQVVGLAAMFILGGIAGTYALEKGEGYDTSIKELEKSTGLNRKDLINLELDKDAEVTSEITGGINAALESASDLMVLGKLIPKGAITGFLAKFLAKNRKTAKALDIAGTAGFEGLTELIQKVDTDLGAKISAGQTLEQALSSIQWKDLKEDFYGGLAGGGAVRMATIGFDKDTENEFNNAVKDIENETKDLDAQLTTGDSELDASLDDLVAGDVKFINNINTELDGIEGGKLQEQLEAATKAAEEATSAQQSAEREALIAKKALEFNQAPVYPLSQAAGTAGPAIAQQEELRAQEAIGQQPVATPKPVEAPVDTPIVETVKEPMVSTPKPLQIKSTYEAAKYEADELHNGGKVNYFNGSNNLRKSVVEIPISELNVREEFSENKIQRLGKYKPPVYDNSATDFPVAVKQGNKLTLIDGHHRLELAKRAGEKTIKVAVKDISDKYTLVNKEKPAPPPVSKGFTTTPKRIGRKKGKEFTFGDEAGTAKGTIVKDAASIQEIYATKDDKGDVKKGGNLYGKTIEKLKENGIKTVVVGAQSPATTAVLAKMVEKGTLSIDPTGDQKVGGNTYHTRFKINSEPKVAVVKPVAKVEPKLSKKEIKEEAAKAAADPYYETPASVKEGDIFKAAKKAGEELEDKRVKLSIQLANAAKRSTKPSLKLAAFEKIAEKANELGLKDLAKEADKLATKEYDLKDQKEADKAERKELKTKREIAKPKLTKDEYNEQRKQEKEEKLLKIAAKSINKPVTIFKGLVSDTEQKDIPLGKAKEQFYVKLAQHTEDVRAKTKRAYTEEDIAAHKAVVAEYKKFREDNGLKPESDESITRATKSDAITAKAKKAILEEGRQATRDKEGAKKQAKADIKAEIMRELGHDPEDFGIIDEKPSKDSISAKQRIQEFVDKKITEKNTKRYTVSEFLSKMKDNHKNIFIKRLLPLVENGLKAQGKKLYIYVSNDKKNQGFYSPGKKGDLLYFSSGVFSESLSYGYDNTNETILHEITHGYFELLANHVNNVDTKFAKQISELYAKTKTNLKSMLISIQNKPIHKWSNSDSKLIELVFDAANQYGDGLILYYAFTSGGHTAVDNIINTIYGLSNKREFLAEGYSQAQFISLLNAIPVEKTSNNFYAKSLSIMHQLITALKAGIGRLKKINHPYFESSIDQFDKIVSFYDSLYEADPNRKFKYDPEYDLVDNIDLKNIGYSPEQIEIYRKNQIKEFRASNSKYFSLDLKPEKDGGKVTKVKLNKEIINNVANTLERRSEIQTQNDVLDYIKRINKNLKAEKQLGDIYSTFILKKIDKMRKERAAVKAQKTKTYNEATAMLEYKDDWKFKDDVDMFNKVDIDDLKLSEAKMFVAEFGKFYYKQPISKKAYDIAIKYGKQKQIVENMISVASKLNQDGSKLTNKVNSMTFSSIMAKYNTQVADIVAKNMYGGAMKAFSKSSTEAHNLDRELDKISEKHKLTHSDFVNVGLYGGVFSTVADPADKQAWEEEVRRNAEFALEAAKNKLSAKLAGVYKGDLSEKQITEEVKLAEKLNTGLDKTMASFYNGFHNHLSKGQKLFYETIRSFSDKNKYNIERNAVGVWGNTDYQSRYNYFPTIVSGKLSGAVEGDELLRNGADNLKDALTAQTFGRDENVTANKSGALEKRVNPKGYYYELDAFAIAKRHVKNILLDTYGSLELKTMNKVLKDPKFMKAFTPRTQAAFLMSLKNITSTAKKHDEETNGVVKFFMGLRDSLYTTALATMGQSILQASSGFVGAAVISANINPKKAGTTFAKAFKYSTAILAGTEEGVKLRKWLEDNGLGIQMRDIFFEKYLSPEDYRKSGSGISLARAANKVNNFNEGFMRKGDKWAATMVWFAAFVDAGGTLENPTENAVIRAERAVGMMQNMSDMNFSAKIFKHDNVYKKIVLGMFYAFKSFALNAEINLIAGARYSLSSNEAKKVMAAQFGSILAYRTLQTIIFGQIYKSLLGDDDDEDKTVSKAEDIGVNSVWDALIGGWSPAVLDSLLRYIANQTVIKSAYKDDYEVWDQYNNSPIYSVTKGSDVLKTAVGPGFKDLLQGMIDIGDYAIEEYNNEEFEYDMDAMENHNDLQKILMLRTVGTTIAATSGLPIPIRGDMKRLIDSIVRMKKKEQRDKNSGGKSGGLGEPNDSEVPQYELPEYNYNPQELNIP